MRSSGVTLYHNLAQAQDTFELRMLWDAVALQTYVMFYLVKRDVIVQFLVLCDWFIRFCEIIKCLCDKYTLISACSVTISPGYPAWFICLWCGGRMLSTNVYWAICYLVIRLSGTRKRLCLQNIIKAHTWWRHQMETFSALLALCAGNSPVTDEFPSKGQWRDALMFSLICAWINGWVNNRDAVDLIRYGAHYDITVMMC